MEVGMKEGRAAKPLLLLYITNSVSKTGWRVWRRLCPEKVIPWPTSIFRRLMLLRDIDLLLFLVGEKGRNSRKTEERLSPRLIALAWVRRPETRQCSLLNDGTGIKSPDFSCHPPQLDNVYLWLRQCQQEFSMRQRRQRPAMPGDGHEKTTTFQSAQTTTHSDAKFMLPISKYNEDTFSWIFTAL